jgi:mRNA interferase MazF
MKKRSVTFSPFDVVIMPFPFADRRETVVRPAVILTPFAGFGEMSGIAMAAMITSAKRSNWPFDVTIDDLASAGLRLPCVVRMKLNAVDYGLMQQKIGELAATDREAIGKALRKVFAGVL